MTNENANNTDSSDESDNDEQATGQNEINENDVIIKFLFLKVI